MASNILSSVLWPIFSFVFGCLVRTVHYLVYQVLLVVKGSKTGCLPIIQDGLLLDPAVVLAENIRTGKEKSETIVRKYIERIRLVNPIINAVVEERLDAALKDAREADHFVQNSGKSPEQIAIEKPLLGVPFTTKEAIAVKGLSMTAGVVCRKGKKASDDCRVVALMREAGAIPLCVTIVPELCGWWDSSNKLHGATLNPYDLTRSPGGSSGGEGALITAAGSIIGLGNDIGGSIRSPCFCCGIFGHKPSKGLVSNEGQFPTTHDTMFDEFNATGPMCRYAVDLAPMLKVIAGPNVKKLKRDKIVDMQNLRVFYTDDYINHPLVSSMDTEMAQSVKKIVNYLQSTHGIKPTKIKIPHMDSFWSVWLTKTQTAAEPSSSQDMVTSTTGELSVPGELFKILARRSNHAFNFLHFKVLGEMQRLPILKALNEKNRTLAAELSSFFDDLLGDDGIFLFPSGPSTTPFLVVEQNLKVYNHAYLGLFNVLGLPVTQCPMGLSSEKLPLGVQVVANLHNDYLTIAVAREIEDQFGGWKSPTRVRLH